LSRTLQLITARAFLATRWRQVILRDRATIERYHAKRLRALVADVSAGLPFYRGYSASRFEALPIIDKSTLLAHFREMNEAGFSVEDLRAALARGEETIGSHVVGQSTGTSGNRGYYVIADAERFLWLGTILGKTLPDALWRRHRVALAMPGRSSLYRSASLGSRIELRFFDLARGMESWVDALVAFAPDTIVASPKVLRWLAERGKLGAARIFSGGEVLDPLDRAVIEATAGTKVREIYMATEGLLGVGCSHGTLHLAEDVMHFEWERPDPQSRLVAPMITDFTRRAQAMMRYRLNDLLELDDRRCPCGSVYQPVRQVVGRHDDILHLPGAAGGRRAVTPDVVRNAVVGSCSAIEDFRIVQTAPDTVQVSLAEDLPADVDGMVQSALAAQLGIMGIAARIQIRRGISVAFDRKLRRVWRGCD
jgi:putative adenylate-forming enzyme